MAAAESVLGYALFAVGCVLILLNWSVAFKNLRNRRRGVERHHSSITLVPQIVMFFSALAFHGPHNPWPTPWFPLWLSLADIALWLLLFQLARVLFSRRVKAG